jgi:ABC-type transporter Mla subunit MlaD
MASLTLTDTDELESVVARLQRLLDEIQNGMDDAPQVAAELAAAGEDLDDFTGRLRQVIGV